MNQEIQSNTEAQFYAVLDNAVLHAQQHDRQKAHNALEQARGMDCVTSNLNRAHWDLCAARLATTFHEAFGWRLIFLALEEFQELGLTKEVDQCCLLLGLNHYTKIKLETPEKTFQLLKDLVEIKKTLNSKVSLAFDSTTETLVLCTQFEEQMTAFLNTDAARKLFNNSIFLEGDVLTQLHWNETPNGVTINNQGSNVSISRVNDGLGYVFQSASSYIKTRSLTIDVLEPHTQKPIMLEYTNASGFQIKQMMDHLLAKQ
jgi:hypothetical protein